MEIQPQYIPFHKLLANRLFRIPRYQRAYSWTKKQREDMFEDIRNLEWETEDSFHFMATIVGLRKETKTIVTDKFFVSEIVDGQQRLTTLVILLKAIEKRLDREQTTEKKLANELQELLVKQDAVSLILLQTNHDRNNYFMEYIRAGIIPNSENAKTIADKEIIQAFKDCESFAEAFDSAVKLLSIVKNQLTFIFHEIYDESTVYTVFEVLNNRGLRVSWLDRLKSMLMAVAFETGQGNTDEHIAELHNIWGDIYQTIGLHQGLSTESLRFAATLKAPNRLSKPLGEADAVEKLRDICATTNDAIALSNWILRVTLIVDKFLKDNKRSKATIVEISHARLLAVAIFLREFPTQDETMLLDLWEKTSFRIFGLCGKDKRTAVGEYVRLAWDTSNSQLSAAQIATKIKTLSDGTEHDIQWAELHLANHNCYEGWEDELLYLFYRYEEHLAKEQGITFSNEQWNRIWESSAARSIEHIYPQSKGSLKPVEQTSDKIFVHRLGNLVILPPGINSELGNKEPIYKCERYVQSGLLCASDVAKIISSSGWNKTTVELRENALLKWIKETWA